MKRKTKRVEARLEQSDYYELIKKCNDLNLNKSEFFRYAIRGYVPDNKLNSEILKLNYELRKIGVNINQIAKHTNQTGIINEAMLNELLKRLNQIILAINYNLLNNKYGCNKFMEDKQ